MKTTTTCTPKMPCGIKPDLSRGFDVMYRNKLLKHFDSYEEACAYAGEKRARVVRFYGKKEEA